MRVPKTLGEAAAWAPGELPEGSRRQLQQHGPDDADDLHFTLGLFIRNALLYRLSTEELAVLARACDPEAPLYLKDPDHISGTIAARVVEMVRSEQG